MHESNEKENYHKNSKNNNVYSFDKKDLNKYYRSCSSNENNNENKKQSHNIPKEIELIKDLKADNNLKNQDINIFNNNKILSKDIQQKYDGNQTREALNLNANSYIPKKNIIKQQQDNTFNKYDKGNKTNFNINNNMHLPTNISFSQPQYTNNNIFPNSNVCNPNMYYNNNINMNSYQYPSMQYQMNAPQLTYNKY